MFTRSNFALILFAGAISTVAAGCDDSEHDDAEREFVDCNAHITAGTTDYQVSESVLTIGPPGQTRDYHRDGSGTGLFARWRNPQHGYFADVTMVEVLNITPTTLSITNECSWSGDRVSVTASSPVQATERTITILQNAFETRRRYRD